MMFNTIQADTSEPVQDPSVQSRLNRLKKFYDLIHKITEPSYPFSGMIHEESGVSQGKILSFRVKDIFDGNAMQEAPISFVWKSIHFPSYDLIKQAEQMVKEVIKKSDTIDCFGRPPLMEHIFESTLVSFGISDIIFGERIYRDEWIDAKQAIDLGFTKNLVDLVFLAEKLDRKHIKIDRGIVKFNIRPLLDCYRKKRIAELI